MFLPIEDEETLLSSIPHSAALCTRPDLAVGGCYQLTAIRGASPGIRPLRGNRELPATSVAPLRAAKPTSARKRYRAIVRPD